MSCRDVRFDAIHPGPQLTPDALDAYVREHSIVLPAPLRRQLLEQNGGAPRDDYCVRMPDGGLEALASFFGVCMKDKSGELAWMAATFDGRIPDGMLPFADDPFGNLFLLSETGPVWFWDQEREGSPEALTRTSDSLDGFMASLVICPE